MDHAFKPAVGIRPKIDLCGHTGTDTFQLALAKVRQHIPISRIEEIKNCCARMGVVSFGDVKSHDLAIKRRKNFGVTEIKIGLLQICPRGVELSLGPGESVLRILKLLFRVDFPPEQLRFPIEILPLLQEVRFQIGDRRSGRIQRGSEIGRINLEQQIAALRIEFEARQLMKYRSEIDVAKLIAQARHELEHNDPEAYKAFLLAVGLGLRRKEIDLLEWPSFRWSEDVLRIEPTRRI